MIRFAIFAAVSSKSQAEEDKISLPEQIKLCRHDGLSRGWRETAGPFIVPGETRTRWVNLRDAENQIINPEDGSRPLKDLLDSAQLRQYDVLILYHYNRLRDLLDAVDKTLSAYGVQMTAHSSWTEPQPPAQYDPLKDTGKILRQAMGFASTSEITELRRRYKLGMPGRILKGLPKGQLPYGWRKPPGRELDRNAVPVPHPLHAPIVLRIKDEFLSGRSLWQIANALNSDHIPAPAGGSWTDVSVRLVLKKRFHSGEIRFREKSYIADPRTGIRKWIDNPPEHVITSKGLHTPLWDMDTQLRIDDEFDKRGKRYSGIRTQRLSHLLYCGSCGARVWVQYPGGYYTDKGRRWACSQDPAHVTRKDSELLPAFIAELVHTIRRAKDAPLPAPPKEKQELNPLVETEARRKRLNAAYLAGAMTLEEFTAEKAALDASLKEAAKQHQQLFIAQSRHKERLAVLGGFFGILENIPNYITQAPPQEVNTQLRQFIQKIIITPDSVSIELIP